jgi:predicted SAM-dependent methyltransferase
MKAITRNESKVMINFGCGMTPVKGYLNFDNSLSIRLKFLPVFILHLLNKFSIINQSNFKFIVFAKENKINSLDVRRKLPIADNSIEFVYSSHMLEHLHRKDAIKFLAEVERILKSGGRLRLVLPDLESLITTYNLNKNADEFMLGSLLYESEESRFIDRIKLFFIGPRKHQWMYDASSLSEVLRLIGFVNVVRLKLGETKTADTGSLNLFEGGNHSIFIEAQKE